MDHVRGETFKEDISTCYVGRHVKLMYKTTATDYSKWIAVSHAVFQDYYRNESLNLEGMELCIFMKDPDCSSRVLEFLEDKPEEESP